MNKQQKKLLKFQDQAQACTTREEAQAILKKARKAEAKILAKALLKG